jgi:hypothetical protein
LITGLYTVLRQRGGTDAYTQSKQEQFHIRVFYKLAAVRRRCNPEVLLIWGFVLSWQ